MKKWELKGWLIMCAGWCQLPMIAVERLDTPALLAVYIIIMPLFMDMVPYLINRLIEKSTK